MIWEHPWSTQSYEGSHTTEDEPCTKQEFTKGRTIFCYTCGVDRVFFPKQAYARCGGCGAEFAYFPIWLNSIKGIDPLPKCPNCGNYRDTVIIGG